MTTSPAELVAGVVNRAQERLARIRSIAWLVRPARAGMSPTTGTRVPSTRRPPRASGDEPALVDALHAYAKEIDERSHPKQRFTDLFASMARRLDDDLFVTARVCEVVIGLGWRPGGAS